MPLVAEANQMSEELEKVRARKWHARSRKGLGEQVQPPHSHGSNWLRGVEEGPEARRGEGLCPRPHSELVTESRPAPRPSSPSP